MSANGSISHFNFVLLVNLSEWYSQFERVRTTPRVTGRNLSEPKDWSATTQTIRTIYELLLWQCAVRCKYVVVHLRDRDYSIARNVARSFRWGHWWHEFWMPANNGYVVLGNAKHSSVQVRTEPDRQTIPVHFIRYWRYRICEHSSEGVSNNKFCPPTAALLPSCQCLKLWQVFYAPQLYRQVLLWRVLAMGILSVCPSVCHNRWYTKPRWDRDSGSSPYDSPESLVSYEVIWCRWVRGFPSNEGIKEGYPLRNRYFTTIGSSSVKTVADRRRLAAYHNKHCRRAFQWYQHRWPW